MMRACKTCGGQLEVFERIDMCPDCGDKWAFRDDVHAQAMRWLRCAHSSRGVGVRLWRIGDVGVMCWSPPAVGRSWRAWMGATGRWRIVDRRTARALLVAAEVYAQGEE